MTPPASEVKEDEETEIKTDKFENKLKLTQHLNAVLEKMILKNPNQWIWSHNRWK